VALLRSHGNEVFTYFRENQAITGTLPIFVGVQSVWNARAYSEVKALVRRHEIDVVHCHNIYPQLSPAIFYAAKAVGAATVQTLHSYKIGCPKGQLFVRGAICERCLGKTFSWPGVLRGCYRKSRMATASIATATASHRLLRTWKDKVDVYVALTEFARGKYIAAGLPAERLSVKANFLHDPGAGAGEGNFVLFVGRLNEEKGIPVLLRGWDGRLSRVQLKIIGAGELEPDVRAAAASDPSMEYLGVQPLATVLELMGQAKALMFPSQWYEGMPRTIVESFAKGTPVIASDLGAMHSMIQHTITGLHFPAGDHKSMLTQLQWMLANDEHYHRMRLRCRENYEANFTPDTNYEMLMKVYQQAIRHNQKPVLGALQGARAGH
jgi:glycosyltransferase involved in cell wall biosynthesis